MKRLHSFLFISAMAFLSACGGNESQENVASTSAADIQITRKEVDSEVVKTVANLSIEGMTCSMGCGGKIQQELRAINGVNTTDLSFEDNRPVNVVAVQFDPTQTDEKKLIECVNTIADGQYHVTAVEIVKYRGLTSHGKASDAGVNSDFGKVFQLLNLLQSITRLVE
jgi:periplasmic mercuric ion binding protein